MIISINKSSLVTRWLLVAHVGAFAAGLTALLGVGLTLLLGLALGLNLWQSLSLHATRGAGIAVLRVQLDHEGKCVLERRNGETLADCRLQGWYASPCLVLLRLRCPQRWWPVNVVVAVDAVDQSDFRALRVALGMRSLAA